MAGDVNYCKSIIKLQALIRGYLVRKKFSQMKCDYSEMVKCMEGNYVNITWRNDSKLCLPIVDHQYPSSRVDVLSDNVQQTNGCDHVRSSLETRVDNSDFLKESLPVQTCTITSENVDRTESVPNADFESTVGSHNSASSDTRSSITNAASKGCLHLNKSLNQGSDLTHKTTDKAIRHTEMTQGNVKKDEQTQPDVTVNGPSEDRMLYPNDETSLIKLRKDLTMELLWIEQAIESRISYLAMKENLDKQVEEK